MQTSEKLAQSLIILKNLQEQGVFAIPAKAISRTHRERLTVNNFLEEIVKGWYIAIRPDEKKGESTAWYASFWNFCSAYLNNRFSNQWCLSPEQSLLIHAENWTVPRQLLVRAPKGSNRIIHLPHNTSLFDVRYKMPEIKNIEEKQGIRVYTIASSLISCSAHFFTQYPTDARAILSMIKDSSELLRSLLEGGHSTIAGRLCGAFHNIGRSIIAEDIKKTMLTAGYEIRENDPFTTQAPILFSHYEKLPYVNRLKVMWYEMRPCIINYFPPPEKEVISIENYLKQVEETYLTDAYHSLSIEGYQVSSELIEKVRSGLWNPEATENDRNHRNALAARGYWQSFQSVEKSVTNILKGENSGKIVERDHKDWYREMFQPSVVAGLLKPSDLAGYRNNAVFIRQSMHVPPRSQIISDLMEAFFQLLTSEKEASVRIVLGHFFFVYIHPYPDGNGRMGRFLMNAMLASGGYPWTVLPVERRREYMEALEQASVKQDIAPFCSFIASCVKD